MLRVVRFDYPLQAKSSETIREQRRSCLQTLPSKHRDNFCYCVWDSLPCNRSKWMNFVLHLSFPFIPSGWHKIQDFLSSCSDEKMADQVNKFINIWLVHAGKTLNSCSLVKLQVIKNKHSYPLRLSVIGWYSANTMRSAH